MEREVVPAMEGIALLAIALDPCPAGSQRTSDEAFELR
jgi:hypothetical protein